MMLHAWSCHWLICVKLLWLLALGGMAGHVHSPAVLGPLVGNPVQYFSEGADQWYKTKVIQQKVQDSATLVQVECKKNVWLPVDSGTLRWITGVPTSSAAVAATGDAADGAHGASPDDMFEGGSSQRARGHHDETAVVLARTYLADLGGCLLYTSPSPRDS